MLARLALASVLLAAFACGPVESCDSRNAATRTGPRAQDIVEEWSRMSRAERIEQLRRTLHRSPDAGMAGDLETDYDACEEKTSAHPNYDEATSGQRYLYFMACMVEKGWKAESP